MLPGRVEEMAGNGLREISIRLLDQQAVAEIKYVAMERKSIGVAALAFYFAGEIEEMRRLPDQIETDVGEGEVDFQHRRMAAPVRQPLPKDQRIIAQAKSVMETFRHGRP